MCKCRTIAPDLCSCSYFVLTGRFRLLDLVRWR